MAQLHDPLTVDADEPLLWCLDTKNFATKRGRIIRTVRERYLRDDLSCALPECSLCLQENDLDAQPSHGVGMTKSILSETPRENVYLLPSMEVVLHQMDLLEFSMKKKAQAPQELFADVILLETVWEFVKCHDLGIYNRLRALIMNPDRRFVVFANEHHRACFVPKSHGSQQAHADANADPDANGSSHSDKPETEQERNRRAVAVAWKWYAAHLQALERNQIKVLFVANDADDLQQAQKLGVTEAITIAKLIEPFQSELPELRDLMSSASGSSESSSSSTNQSKKLFREHLKMSEVLSGIKNKKFFQGVLRCNRDHWLECHVLIHGDQDTNIPVLIQGQENINRAVDGDVVAIQLLPKSQWKKPSDAYAASGTTDDQQEEETSKEEQDEQHDRSQGAEIAEPTVPLEQAEVMLGERNLSIKPIGRVVGIIQRNWRKYCGSIEPPRSASSITSSTNCLFVPVDRKIPKIKIQTRQMDTLMDKRIVVCIDSWPADSRYPLGHYVKTLGVIGDKETETNVLLMEHDIPCEEFSEQVMKCLPPDDWKITPENSKGRTDLRHLPVMSIDPPNCKDIDDALSASMLPNGNLQVGVHIADVTHFVVAGSPLDEEAADRGTSTYLVDRRLDMLPGLLTTKLCSLTSTEDHFAFSVLWEMRLTDDDVEVIDVSFCKSLIRSIASLSYQQAQVLLDDPEAGEVLMGSKFKAKKKSSKSEGDRDWILGSGIKTLYKIAKKLRAKRVEAGALTLASPEVKFVLDTETQNPLDVQMYTLHDTNALVEEFMLLANITVAKKIVRHFPTFSMLRRHPAPSKRQFDVLCSQAKAVGVQLQVDTSKQLQNSLDRADSNAKNKYFNKLLRILCTRCMMPAKYFSSGEVAPKEFHHYGLAAPIYTHFTSPIRRYADVVVHRLLAAAIGVTALPGYLENKSHLHEITEQLNRRHHAAQLAGRASVGLHTLLYFQKNPTETDAMVTKVKSNGVGVLLPRFGIEGMILVCDKGDEKDPNVVQFDGERHTLTLLKPTKRRLQVFDKVRVKVFVALTFGNRQELKMELVNCVEEKEAEQEEEKTQTEEQQVSSGSTRKRKPVASRSPAAKRQQTNKANK